MSTSFQEPNNVDQGIVLEALQIVQNVSMLWLETNNDRLQVHLCRLQDMLRGRVSCNRGVRLELCDSTAKLVLQYNSLLPQNKDGSYDRIDSSETYRD